jgi:uridine kinase
MARIISVTGLPGSGKSTLVKGLSDRIKGSVILRHDDYSEFLTANKMNNRNLFMSEAARKSMKGGFWDNRKVTEDLRKLKQGRSVYNEYTGITTGPAPMVILDGLIGRWQPGCGELVDFAIMLDVPLEIALSRRLLQICRSYRSRTDPESMRKQYIDVLLAYMEGGIHTSYVRFREKALAHADLVLDGMLTPDRQAGRVLAVLSRSCLPDRTPASPGSCVELPGWGNLTTGGRLVEANPE